MALESNGGLIKLDERQNMNVTSSFLTYKMDSFLLEKFDEVNMNYENQHHK